MFQATSSFDKAISPSVTSLLFDGSSSVNSRASTTRVKLTRIGTRFFVYCRDVQHTTIGTWYPSPLQHSSQLLGKFLRVYPEVLCNSVVLQDAASCFRSDVDWRCSEVKENCLNIHQQITSFATYLVPRLPPLRFVVKVILLLFLQLLYTFCNKNYIVNPKFLWHFLLPSPTH